MQPLCSRWGHQLTLNPLSAGGEQGLQASNLYVPWPLAASSDGGLGTIDAAGQAPGP